jgi:hypothetical protein
MLILCQFTLFKAVQQLLSIDYPVIHEHIRIIVALFTFIILVVNVQTVQVLIFKV